MPSKDDDDKEDKEGEVAEDENAGIPEEVPQSILLQLAQWRFLLTLADNEYPRDHKTIVKDNMMDMIRANNMIGYYRHYVKTLGWTEDAALVTEMEVANAAALKVLEEKVVDAEKNLGETEVREALQAIADFQAQIGEKDKAVEAYNTTLEKTVGSGMKIDLVFSVIRMGMSWDDRALVKANVAKAHDLVEAGGDWERRNRLGVYKAMHLLMLREFKEAAELLLKAISTFTCYELFDYNTLIFYTVVAATVALDRVTLRTKVVKSPEILSSIGEVPNLEPFLFSLYKCKYSEFFHALAAIHPQIKTDGLLSAHAGYFMREIRIVAYAQFLQSYRSVTLDSMAKSFGVTKEFVDRELSRFIAAGRLACKIDKVAGVVETNRPDAKNLQYQSTIKQGDLLLNRIQKLTKVISY